MWKAVKAGILALAQRRATPGDKLHGWIRGSCRMVVEPCRQPINALHANSVIALSHESAYCSAIVSDEKRRRISALHCLALAV